MKQYHKIQTVYFRDQNNNNKTLLEGEWSKPEFELLKDIEWTCTEKIDGTNIRVMWDGKNISFGGKTDNAQIPSMLINRLKELFTNEKMSQTFESDATEVCLYGEGYGAKIQKGGGNYIPDNNSFILFDVKIGQWWLTRESIVDIAKKLDIMVVPIIAECTLMEAIEIVKQGFTSTISDNINYIAEGLIMKPSTELLNRRGERIITKIKYKDFKRG